MVRGLAPPTIDIAADFAWTGEPLSLTVTVKVDVPPEVGVPEIVPVVESDRPACKLPEVIDHE